MHVEEEAGQVAQAEDEDDHHQDDAEVLVVPLPASFPPPGCSEYKYMYLVNVKKNRAEDSRSNFGFQGKVFGKT